MRKKKAAQEGSEIEPLGLKEGAPLEVAAEGDAGRSWVVQMMWRRVG